MTLSRQELLVLEVVRLSDGRSDTCSLDFEYHSRSQEPLEPHLLGVLRTLEARGLVAEVLIAGGTGPGWKLTE